MHKSNFKGKILTILLFAILFFPSMGICNHSNFLPMEDAMSAARNAPENVYSSPLPYRQPFNLGNQDSTQRSYLDFTTSDVCAFILLAGLYVMLVRRGSKSRNASF